MWKFSCRRKGSLRIFIGYKPGPLAWLASQSVIDCKVFLQVSVCLRDLTDREAVMPGRTISDFTKTVSSREMVRPHAVMVVPPWELGVILEALSKVLY